MTNNLGTDPGFGDVGAMGMEPRPDGSLFELRAAPARRYFALAVLYALGVLLCVLAWKSHEAALGWRFVMFALGLGVFMLATLLGQATKGRLVLTETALLDGEGRVITELSNITSVDRGALAVKPSNGFTLRLRKRITRRWQPGLFWAHGKRVGVGGVTQAGAGKALAEMIQMRVVKD
ncbi:MAG: hypothetical protein ACRBBV_01810 [Paracoccaceae bacterium]